MHTSITKPQNSTLVGSKENPKSLSYTWMTELIEFGTKLTIGRSMKWDLFILFLFYVPRREFQVVPTKWMIWISTSPFITSTLWIPQDPPRTPWWRRQHICSKWGGSTAVWTMLKKTALLVCHGLPKADQEVNIGKLLSLHMLVLVCMHTKIESLLQL